MENPVQKVFVVFNPKAGDQDQGTELRSLLEQYFTSPRWSIEIHETKEEEDVTAICRAACDQGASLVVSAGGDGTVVSVANALVHRKVPMGILPLGTGNLLANVLSIPSKLEEAIQLLAGEHSLIEIDALKVGERYFLSNVSVGISPIIMGETTSAQKKRFGMLAYVWTTIYRSHLFNVRRYSVTIDGQPRLIRASEVLISNTPFFEKPTTLYGSPETLHDGQFEVYLAAVHSLSDYLRLVWDLFRDSGEPGAMLHHWECHQSIRIDAIRSQQFVQGDGEVIGQTPVEVKMVPRAVQVILPKPSER